GVVILAGRAMLLSLCHWRGGWFRFDRPAALPRGNSPSDQEPTSLTALQHSIVRDDIRPSPPSLTGIASVILLSLSTGGHGASRYVWMSEIRWRTDNAGPTTERNTRKR